MTATMPTDEQLREYAAQLPDLYKDILAAYQSADPSRARGEGLFESTLRNFLKNELFRSQSPIQTALDRIQRTPFSPKEIGPRYQFSRAFDDFGESGVTEAVDRMIEEGFIEPRGPEGVGSLIPTEIGERLIEVVAGRSAPGKRLPGLPKPTWR